MYKVLKGLALTGLLILVPHSAIASSTTGYGTISAVTVTSTGAVLFNLDLTKFDIVTKTKLPVATRDTLPSCASSQPSRWAIDGSTVAGQAAVMTLLWAAQANKPVSAVGSGSCSIVFDVETVASMTVQDPDS